MLIDNLIPLRYNMWYLRRGGDRMDIHGLQKLTLLDFPGHVACTVFLAGCDFRCPFCHNGGLVLGGMEPVMDDAGLLDFLRRRQGLLDGVAVTGGEPLLRPDLPPLLRAVKDLGYAVKLDTIPPPCVRWWRRAWWTMWPWISRTARSNTARPLVCRFLT